MITRTLASAALACLIAVGPASHLRAAEEGVAGTWNLTVKGPAAHGDLAATLVLKQDGKAVTGQFSAHGNEHSLKGEFAAGTLTLESPDGPSDRSLSLTAKLRDDGTLSGYVSSPMGDMPFTGKRS
jgi:hypothetical protein